MRRREALTASLALAAAIFAQVTAPPPTRVLHLADAERVALERQPTMRQAKAQASAAQARVDEARAPLYPQLNGAASYQRLRTPGFSSRAGLQTGGPATATSPSTGTNPTSAGPSISAAAPGGVDLFAFGGNMSFLLWDFGQTYNKYKAADRLALSAQADQRTTTQAVLLDVRQSYFAVTAQKALVKVAAETLANLQRHLDQVAGFVTQGTRPAIDLAQSRADLANGRVQLINAVNALSNARTQLARAIGDLTTTDIDVADDDLPPIPGEDLSADVLTAQALHDRPEVVSLERQREAQAFTLGAIRGGFGPSISMSGGLQEIGTSLDSLNPAWSVGAALSWPLFQGGLTVAQVREGEANLAAATAQLDAQRLQVGVDVQSAKLSLGAAKATFIAQQEVVDNAAERLRLAEGRYTQGVGSLIELSDAQVTMTTAAAQLVQARFNIATARATLLSTLGRR